MATHADFATGLRQLADFIEAHPELDLPSDPALKIYPTDSREEAARYARALGRCEKDYSSGQLAILRRRFGPIELAVLFWRETVCRKVVTGTLEVPERTVTTPARTEEIVEWVCDEPILAVAE